MPGLVVEHIHSNQGSDAAQKQRSEEQALLRNAPAFFDGSSFVNSHHEKAGQCLISKNNKFSLDEDGNLVVNSITTNSESSSSLDSTAVCDLIYPVGSIYMSVNSTSPASLFGGTWTQLKDRFLLGAGDTYSNGTTGGSSELQSHSHSIPALSGTAASSTHSHIVTTKTTSYGSGTQTNWRCLSWPGTSADYTQTVYTNNGTADGAHTHNVTTSASTSGTTGTGTGNNMPPYLTVYMWKRTA